MGLLESWNLHVHPLCRYYSIFNSFAKDLGAIFYRVLIGRIRTIRRNKGGNGSGSQSNVGLNLTDWRKSLKFQLTC